MVKSTRASADFDRRTIVGFARRKAKTKIDTRDGTED